MPRRKSKRPRKETPIVTATKSLPGGARRRRSRRPLKETPVKSPPGLPGDKKKRRMSIEAKFALGGLGVLAAVALLSRLGEPPSSEEHDLNVNAYTGVKLLAAGVSPTHVYRAIRPRTIHGEALKLACIAAGAELTREDVRGAQRNYPVIVPNRTTRKLLERRGHSFIKEHKDLWFQKYKFGTTPEAVQNQMVRHAAFATQRELWDDIDFYAFWSNVGGDESPEEQADRIGNCIAQLFGSMNDSRYSAPILPWSSITRLKAYLNQNPDVTRALEDWLDKKDVPMFSQLTVAWALDKCFSGYANEFKAKMKKIEHSISFYLHHDPNGSHWEFTPPELIGDK